ANIAGGDGRTALLKLLEQRKAAAAAEQRLTAQRAGSSTRMTDPVGPTPRWLTPERRSRLEPLIERLLDAGAAVPPFHRVLRDKNGNFADLVRLNGEDFAQAGLAALGDPILETWPDALASTAPGAFGQRTGDPLPADEARAVLIRLWEALDGRAAGEWDAI